jgi:drug/metabolite transporter (DMT)-like permease
VTREREGLFLCLASAAGFGAMAIFAKKSYEAGLDVTTLLALRFVLAAVLLWALVAAARRALGDPRALAAGAALGVAGYSLQSGLYFSALTRISAGLTALLLYAYPALVTVAAIALQRESAERRRIGALVIATGGVALVLLGGGLGGNSEVDPLGALMALGAAGAYTVYILVSDGLTSRAGSLPFAASVCTGAAVSVGAVALVKGPSDLSAEALGWVVGLALLSTVMPIVFFFAGLERVGPSTASILSTIEPPVTVGLAWLVFSETLGALQLAGGVLVLSAVVLLQLRRSAAQRSAPASVGQSPVWRFRSSHPSSPSSPAPPRSSPRARAGSTSPSGTASARSRS